MEKIPVVVIFRLAEYHCLLSEIMKTHRVDRITSREIASFLGLSEEIVRKDLSYVPYDTGTPGVGYSVIKLYQAISKVLHVDSIHNVILIGSMQTWRGIFNFFDPRKFGFQPVMMFSEVPVDRGLFFDQFPVYSIEEIPEQKPEEVKIAIIACEPSWAQRASQLCIQSNIKGILNLTPTVLEDIPEDVYVSQILLPCEIKLVTYHILENLNKSHGEKLKRDIGKRASLKRERKNRNQA
jgi:redox-sensing transcriptional repressor